LPVPSQILRNKFPFDPTDSQLAFFKVFDEFWKDHKSSRPTLLVKGYAGTGKTTLVSVLVKVLPLFNFKYLLLAPTGRAAKVMASYTGRKAFTIHKIIYRQISTPDTASLEFKPQKSYHKDTVFIIDEVSMLADDLSETNQVLQDLIRFVFSHPGNKLILIGDRAQLPPVGQEISVGLDKHKLQSKYGLDVLDTEMTQVMRQKSDSGVLFNATRIREQLSRNENNFQFKLHGFNDIYRMSGERLEEGLRYAHQKYGSQNTIVICRSNKSAVRYNEFIRRMIFFYDNEIDAGDHLMIVRNNYFFLPEDSSAGFLANGDFVEIRKIITLKEMYSFRFATLELQMVDYPDQEAFEAKVFLETLHSDHSSLTPEQNKKLYQEVSVDYQDYKPSERKKLLRQDPYLNALQIKFAYALTCHKSQGGQWDAVFVDQGFLKQDMVNSEYLRWLYTALTRSTSELFLVNFHSNFF